MKAFSFLIQSNIMIALAAVSLAMATGAELGIPFQFHDYLLVIFLSTLFDYNLHRFIALYNEPEAVHSEMQLWSSDNRMRLKLLLLFSLAGLVISLFFVGKEILIVLVPLALLSFSYSIRFPGQQKYSSLLLWVPGIKTLLIALVWSSATVFIPFLQSGFTTGTTSVMLIFAERFTFIFAIAIPFDIRDMKRDALAGIMSLPVIFGKKRALQICNSLMLISLFIACYHYFSQNMPFIFIAYFVSIVLTLIFINSRKIKSYPLYYHGILDGSIILHGLLISLGFLLFNYLFL